MPLALNRLRVGRYTLVVLAKNSAGRSPRLRVPVRVTGGLRSRALLAQRALAAKAAAVAAAATVPLVAASAPPAPASPPPPAAGGPAPAATAGTEAAPAPLVCDKAATDHSGHGHGGRTRGATTAATGADRKTPSRQRTGASDGAPIRRPVRVRTDERPYASLGMSTHRPT